MEPKERASCRQRARFQARKVWWTVAPECRATALGRVSPKHMPEEEAQPAAMEEAQAAGADRTG